MKQNIVGPLREQSDWEQNDENRLGFIKNKPFYDTRKTETLTIEWDGNTENRDSFVGSMFKVSDIIVTYEELIGGSVKAIERGVMGEITITAENAIDYDEFDDNFPMLVQFGEVSLIACFKNDAIIGDETVTKGIYFIKADIDGVSICTTELRLPSVEVGELKTIDPKFLPSPYLDLSQYIGTVDDITAEAEGETTVENAKSIMDKILKGEILGISRTFNNEGEIKTMYNLFWNFVKQGDAVIAIMTIGDTSTQGFIVGVDGDVGFIGTMQALE